MYKCKVKNSPCVPCGSYGSSLCDECLYTKIIKEIASLRAELARERERADEAEADMKVMALAMRESDEMPEGCCFACIYDAQNLPDNCILAYGECPGYDKTDCFEWRGKEDDHANG